MAKCLKHNQEYDPTKGEVCYQCEQEKEESKSEQEKQKEDMDLMK